MSAIGVPAVAVTRAREQLLRHSSAGDGSTSCVAVKKKVDIASTAQLALPQLCFRCPNGIRPRDETGSRCALY